MTPTRKFEMLPHTADLRARVFGATLEELFQNALEALMTILGEGVGRVGKAKVQAVHVTADSTTNLLIDFLSEALYLANVEKAIYEHVHFETFSETELRATLAGQTVDGFAEDVKAVAYHDAKIRKDAAGNLTVELVFDV